MQWWLSYDQVSETNLPTIECKHSIFDKQFISNEFETIDIRKEKKGKKKGKKCASLNQIQLSVLILSIGLSEECFEFIVQTCRRNTTQSRRRKNLGSMEKRWTNGLDLKPLKRKFSVQAADAIYKPAFVTRCVPLLMPYGHGKRKRNSAQETSVQTLKTSAYTPAFPATTDTHTLTQKNWKSKFQFLMDSISKTLPPLLTEK